MHVAMHRLHHRHYIPPCLRHIFRSLHIQRFKMLSIIYFILSLVIYDHQKQRTS